MSKTRSILALLMVLLLVTSIPNLGPQLHPNSLIALAGQLNNVEQSGTFVDSGQTLTSSSTSLALGDLERDGDIDVVLGSETGVVRWFNRGGMFSSAGQNLGSSYTIGLALGDLNADGYLDIFSVVDTSTGNQVWLQQPSTPGTFVSSGQEFGDDLSTGLALGDVDGDGDLDAFVTRLFGRMNKVWLNNGSGTFSDSGQNFNNSDSTGVALGDVDSDGDLDAFITGDNVNTIWLNQGGVQNGTTGIFVNSNQQLTDQFSIGVSLADIDRDGDLDAATASVNGGVHLWINQGGSQAGSAGVFEAGGTLGTAGNRHVTLVDVDGDGDRDLFIARSNANTVWLNQGGLQNGTVGQFVDSGQQLGNLFSSAAAFADLDGDNDADAVVTNSTSSTQVWRNQGISGTQTTYQIRDTVMSSTPRGQHYIGLCSSYSPEIINLMLTDRTLLNRGYTTLIQWLPNLQTMVDGSGGKAQITQPQVDSLDGFFDDLAVKGSSELRQTITAERAAQPELNTLVGKTMDEARLTLLGPPVSVTYLPVVSTSGTSAATQIQNSTQATNECFLICLLDGTCR